MKKSKKRKKVRVVKKSSRKSFLAPMLVILFLILGFIFLANAIGIYRGRQAANIERKTQLVSIPYSDWSFRKFSATNYKGMAMPSATPKPQVLSGYCLRVPVLMYHHIQPEATAKELGQTALTVDSGVFEGQMAYLAQNGYTTLWANELINALITHAPLPAKSIVITMDDGYADNYIYALPVLQKYGLKSNLMLATGLMGNADMLSWDQVKGLKSSGLIYFTNHTWSHYPVTKPPQDKIELEIDTAQNQIQQNTGQTVNVFTYPYGAFNDNAIATLQRKGYLGAFTEIPGQVQCDSFLMTLHRTRIGNSSLSSYGV